MAGVGQRESLGNGLPGLLGPSRRDGLPGRTAAREAVSGDAAFPGAVRRGTALGKVAPENAASGPGGTAPDGENGWHEHGWGLDARQVGLIFLTILAVSLLLRLLGAVPGW